jgi:hypothetical protein
MMMSRTKHASSRMGPEVEHASSRMGPEVEPGRAVARSAVFRDVIQETDALRNQAARSVTDRIKATSETGTAQPRPPQHTRGGPAVR